jgi:hypothetical protein
MTEPRDPGAPPPPGVVPFRHGIAPLPARESGASAISSEHYYPDGLRRACRLRYSGPATVSSPFQDPPACRNMVSVTNR